MAKAKPKCWCGFKAKTTRGLSIHKNRADHWQTPQEKQAAEDLRKHYERENSKRTEGYIGEENHRLQNGRHLKVGDKIRFERYAIVKEITYTGETNETVDVKVDLITKTYEHIPHAK